jgi:histone acetyltransferase MYST4
MGHPLAGRSFQSSFGHVSASPSPENTRHHEGPSSLQVMQYSPNAAPQEASIPSSTAGKRRADASLDESSKRTRVSADGADDDEDAAMGAKHWSDSDKTKLFQWLMAPDNDEHFRSLRSAKNSCLREVTIRISYLYVIGHLTALQCAAEVFDSKKTYQALKGCYEVIRTTCVPFLQGSSCL